MTEPAPVVGAIDGLFRRSAARLVALLTARLGAHRLDLAEEAVQDALLRALQVWPHRGMPNDPEAWLHTVARNRAIDILRRESRSADQSAEAPTDLATMPDPSSAAADEVRLLLLAAHPSLTPRARVALALKTVGGFGVREIARALFSEETAVAQVLVRAKRTIRESGLELAAPTAADLSQRLQSALETLYLMFNEGHLATAGDEAVREDVCLAAIRLGQLLAADPETNRPEVHALLALMCLQASRLPARLGSHGELQTLDRQDRSLWDPGLIAEGFRHLDCAAVGTRLTPWHLEAAIASHHAQAARAAKTDWTAILALYDELLVLKPSPVARLNRAVAVSRVEGPVRALEEVRDIARHPAMANYYLLAALEAELLCATGDHAGARVALQRAIPGARTDPERKLLAERLAGLSDVTSRRPDPLGPSGQ